MQKKNLFKPNPIFEVFYAFYVSVLNPKNHIYASENSNILCILYGHEMWCVSVYDDSASLAYNMCTNICTYMFIKREQTLWFTRALYSFVMYILRIQSTSKHIGRKMPGFLVDLVTYDSLPHMWILCTNNPILILRTWRW